MSLRLDDDSQPLRKSAPPEVGPLDEQALRFERQVRADLWLQEYMDEDEVARMLANKYGYSLATARRDIKAAQELIGSLETHPRKYFAKLMINKIGKAVVMAIDDRKFRDLAALSKEYREWLMLADAFAEQERQHLSLPVPRTIAFAPEQLGVERNPNILQEAQEIIEQKTGKPFVMPVFHQTPPDIIPDAADGQSGGE